MQICFYTMMLSAVIINLLEVEKNQMTFIMILLKIAHLLFILHLLLACSFTPWMKTENANYKWSQKSVSKCTKILLKTRCI